MKPEAGKTSEDSIDEISALIETLVNTEQRLEELTGGEVDSVTGLDGRTILLRRAQEQLRSNNAKKQAAILDALAANIVLIDARGIIVSVNEGWRLFADANELDAPEHGIGLDYLEICERATGIDQAEARKVAAGLRSVLSGDQRNFTWEYPCHSPTMQRWYVLTATPLSDDRQKGVVVSHLDITERKLSEGAIAESELKFRTLFEYAPDGIIIASPDSYYLDSNASICRMLGYTHRELLGRHASDIVTRSEQKHLQPTMDSIDDDSDHSGVWLLKRKDGSVFPGDVLVTQMPDGNLMAMIRDISDQERTRFEKDNLNKQIETERSRLRNIVASVPGVVWEAWGQPDAFDQRIDFVSDYVETLLGYTTEEWMATPNFWLSLVHPDDREAEARAARSVFDVGSGEGTRQFRWRKKSGDYVWVEAKSVAVVDDNGIPVGMRGVTVDITARKRLEDERRTIAKIMEGVISTPDLGEFLKLVHRSIGEIIYAENCFVMLHEPVTDIISFEFWVDKRDPCPKPKRRGNGFASYVLNTGKPMLMTAEDKRVLIEQGKARPIGSSSASWIGVPLRTPAETFGVLVLQHYDLENAYTERDLDFLTSVGDQVALAIARNRADLELVAAEEKYRLIFENSTDGIFQMTSDGRLLSANPALALIMGFPSPAEMIRERTDVANQAYANPSQREEFKRIIEEKGFVNGYEVEVRRKDGATIWISENIRIVRDEAGRELYYEGSLRDVTERKRAEAAAAQLVAIVESSDDAIIGKDLQGIVTSWNPGAQHLFGYSATEMTGQSISLLIPPDRQEEEADILNRVKGGEHVRHFETVRLRKDGSPINISVTVSPIRDPHGNIVGASKVASDITERKLASEALADSERELRKLTGELERERRRLVEAQAMAKLGSWHTDLVTMNVIWSEETCRIFESDPTQRFIDHEMFLSFVHPDDRAFVNKAFEDSMASESECSLEHRLLLQDGKIKFVEERWRVLRDAEGNPLRAVGTVMDITERKAGQLALVESNEKFRQLADHITDAFWIRSLDFSEVHYVSPAFETIWGRSIESLYANPGSWTEFVFPDDRSRVAEAFDELRRGIPGLDIQYRIARPDGELRCLRVRGFQVKSADGTPLSFAGIVTDITDRTVAEEALKESESRFRLLFESMMEGYAYCELVYEGDEFVDLIYLEVNGAFGDLTGLSDVVGKKLTDLLPGIRETNPEVFSVYGRVAQTGESAKLDVFLESLGGWFSISLYSSDKYHLTAIFENVTERKQFNASLLASEANLAKAQQIAHLGSWDLTISKEGSVNDGQLRWSDEVFRIFGYEPGQIEVNSEVFFNAVHPDDRANVTAAIAMALRDGEDYRVDHRILRPDGTERFVHEHSEIIRDDDTGEVLRMVGTVQDITTEKELGEQLRQSQKMEAIGVLAGGIAHDFNNLLTAINGYSALTLKKMAPDDPCRHNIEEVKNAGDRAAELTSQLLAFSRKQVLQPSVVNLNAVISNIQNMLRRIIRENIELRVVLDSNLGNVRADAGQIEQVIMNLAINARDAMPKGGTLTIETSNVHLDEQYVSHHIAIAPGDFVRMTVTDTGEGIDEATRSHIFDPFFTTKEVGKGTGLGLSTVYGVVQQSGGDVTVHSELAHGTTFTIYLPAVSDSVEKGRWADLNEEAFAGTETILLVEDEEVVRTFVKTILKDNGYNVLEAANGYDALEIGRTYKDPIDMLLTDLIMPRMSGTELKTKILALRPGIRCLFMSGYTDDSISEHGVLNSETAFIEKPFSPDAISQKIREVLEA